MTQHSAVSALIRQLLSIQHLALHLLDPEGLEHISRLQNLKSLTLEKLPTINSFPTISNVPIFPTLHTVHIAHASLLSATRFLGLWDAVPLNSFKLRYSNSPDCATAADIYNFFSALSVGCSHSSLTTLVVRSRWDWNALNITDSRFFFRSRAAHFGLYSLSPTLRPCASKTLSGSI